MGRVKDAVIDIADLYQQAADFATEGLLTSAMISATEATKRSLELVKKDNEDAENDGEATSQYGH